MALPELSYCASLVRAHDRDRYICTLFAPADIRESWFALFAFNHELAAIPETVSEEMMGFIRFAWWREALDEIYGGKPARKHPVAEALGQAVTIHKLPRIPLDALLEARQARFGGEGFTGLEQWEDYFRKTSSGLLTLCAQAAREKSTDALEMLGIVWAALGTAREVGDEELRSLATRLLSDLPPVSELFIPFRDTAEYYLKFPEKKGGSTVGLLFKLLTKRILRRIGS